MKRTPRSARRRASRQFEANDPSPGLAPYISNTLAGSLLMSIRSGTLDCMRKAISYCAMRVRISGSWVALYSRRFSAFTACTDSLCAASLTPGGFRTCSTASPKEFSFTPWNRLGRMPLDPSRAYGRQDALEKLLFAFAIHDNDRTAAGDILLGKRFQQR